MHKKKKIKRADLLAVAVCLWPLSGAAEESSPGLILTQGRLFLSTGGYTHQVVSVENKTTRTFESIEVECGFYAGTQLLTSDYAYIEGLEPKSLGHKDVTTSNAGGATSAKCRIVRAR